MVDGTGLFESLVELGCLNGCWNFLNGCWNKIVLILGWNLIV
jgi:hypothetical protein